MESSLKLSSLGGIRTVVLGGLLSLCIAGNMAAEAATPKTNVVVIVADDLGYADLSSYGSKDIQTPNIDALARGGVRFTNGYSSGPVCSPSRAGLITGRYQQRFGFDANAEGYESDGDRAPRALDISQVTLAQRLKDQGYATGIFGKWHLGAGEEYLPTRRGFDEFYGILPHGIGAGGPEGPPVYRGTKIVEKPVNHVEQFGTEALSFIDRNAEKPFFLYLPLTAVHGPFVGAQPWIRQFDTLTPANRRNYAADLVQADDVVGRIVARLKDQKIDEQTLIVFYSDNGGPGGAASNGPLRGTKWTLWEGGIRVPFIINWKGRIPAGRTLDQPVIQVDIAHTALAAAGAEVKPEWKLDGANLLPLLEGKTEASPHDALYWRFGVQYAIRQGDWKLVKPHVDSSPKLFDVRNDIGETNDLAKQHPERVKSLQSLWDSWNAGNEPPRWIDNRWNGDGPGERKRAKRNVAHGPTTRPAGPWASGDALSSDESPDIANQPLSITADVDAEGPNGVIVAQGGTRLGYSVYLVEGKPAVATRVGGQLTTVIAEDAVGKRQFTIHVDLSRDGAISLSVDGKQVAEGKAPGLIPAQPGDGLSIGADVNSAVGDYQSPNALKGKVSNVRVSSRASTEFPTTAPTAAALRPTK